MLRRDSHGRLRGYLDTCPKNDVILFSRKRFCALGLGFGLELWLGLGLRLESELPEIRLNTFFGQTSIRAGKCTRST